MRVCHTSPYTAVGLLVAAVRLLVSSNSSSELHWLRTYTGRLLHFRTIIRQSFGDNLHLIIFTWHSSDNYQAYLAQPIAHSF